MSVWERSMFGAPSPRRVCLSAMTRTESNSLGIGLTLLSLSLSLSRCLSLSLSLSLSYIPSKHMLSLTTASLISLYHMWGERQSVSISVIIGCGSKEWHSGRQECKAQSQCPHSWTLRRSLLNLWGLKSVPKSNLQVHQGSCADIWVLYAHFLQVSPSEVFDGGNYPQFIALWHETRGCQGKHGSVKKLRMANNRHKTMIRRHPGNMICSNALSHF